MLFAFKLLFVLDCLFLANSDARQISTAAQPIVKAAEMEGYPVIDVRCGCGIECVDMVAEGKT